MGTAQQKEKFFTGVFLVDAKPKGFLTPYKGES